jgi:hypothetical protein
VIASFIAESNIMCVVAAPSRKLVVAGDRSGRLHFFRIEGDGKKCGYKYRSNTQWHIM